VANSGSIKLRFDALPPPKNRSINFVFFLFGDFGFFFLDPPRQKRTFPKEKTEIKSRGKKRRETKRHLQLVKWRTI